MMVSIPMFSIIIPAYNVAEYLEKCIESIEQQSIKDYEIILVDDGSTDGTEGLCDIFGGKYENIMVIHQKNTGLSEARNTGIKQASGMYCMFVDADDFIYRECLKNIKQFILKRDYPQLIVLKRLEYQTESDELRECMYVYDEEKLNALNRAKQYRELWLLPECILGAWLFLPQTQYLKENDVYFYRGLLHEDEEWVPRIFLNAKTVNFLNAPVYCGRINREGGITSTPNIQCLFDRLKIIELRQKEFSSEKYTDEVRKTVWQRTRMICFGILPDMQIYKNESAYNELLEKMSCMYLMLKDSEKISHKVVYWGIRIFGIRAVIPMLSMLKNH